jgi:hypothetical protein
MINIGDVIVIIFVHWVADFILQDEKWALGKSKNFDDLIKHTVTYSLCWAIPIFWLILFTKDSYSAMVIAFTFVQITFIFHTLTDYFTSKIVSKLFNDKKYGSPVPNFGGFTMIGFDQVLHYMQLFLTFYLLK